MADESKRIIGPGYQGSDKSGVEVTFYAHGNDPVFQLQGFKGAFQINGAAGSSRHEGDSSLLGTSTIARAMWNKQIGGGAGHWSLDVKTHRPEIFQRGLNDTDWVDITFTQHGRRYHQVRGMVDTIRENRSVNNNATDKTFTISGRDHTKVFEDTSVFFNRFIGENVGGGATLRAFINSNQGASIWGDVKTTVSAFLFEFLRQLGGSANARWALPPGIPGLTVDTGSQAVFFLDAIQKFYNVTGYTNEPERTALRAMFLDPEGFVGHNLWDLAREWSDPSFCELFCDLVKSDGSLPGVDEELLPDQSAMAVILRDRPFPTAASNNFSLANSPWYSLPLHIVARQEMENTDEGRGGEERFNAFFVRASVEAEFSSANIDITKPIWDPNDIAIRGIRRMDVTSTYVHPKGNNADLVRQQKEFLRDWYGLNPYLLNGTLPLGHMRPEIRVGSRVRIPGDNAQKDLTYYVEGVSHTWALNQGRTSLNVTRGWEGDDQSYMKEINALPNRFVLPPTIVTNDSVTLTNIA